MSQIEYYNHNNEEPKENTSVNDEALVPEEFFPDKVDDESEKTIEEITEQVRKALFAANNGLTLARRADEKAQMYGVGDKFRLNTKAAQRAVWALICALIFVPIWYFVQTFVHELAHGLVSVAYGGAIHSVTFGLNAQIAHSGAHFSLFGEALMNAAGMLAVFVIGIIVLCVYKPKAKFVGWHSCALVVCVGTIAAMLPWAVLPIASLFKAYPIKDDVIKFLYRTKISVLAVALNAVLLIAIYIILAHKRGLLKTVWHGFKKLNANYVFADNNSVDMLDTYRNVLCYDEIDLTAEDGAEDDILADFTAIFTDDEKCLDLEYEEDCAVDDGDEWDDDDDTIRLPKVDMSVKDIAATMEMGTDRYCQ